MSEKQMFISVPCPHCGYTNGLIGMSKIWVGKDSMFHQVQRCVVCKKDHEDTWK